MPLYFRVIKISIQIFWYFMELYQSFFSGTRIKSSVMQDWPDRCDKFSLVRQTRIKPQSPLVQGSDNCDVPVLLFGPVCLLFYILVALASKWWVSSSQLFHFTASSKNFHFHVIWWLRLWFFSCVITQSDYQLGHYDNGVIGSLDKSG